MSILSRRVAVVALEKNALGKVARSADQFEKMPTQRQWCYSQLKESQ
jgi:hypothetical protein